MTENPKAHIMLDAFNLTSTEGMGIQTYTKTLGTILTGAGYDVSLLYGQRAKPRNNPALFETTFYDFKTRQNQVGKRKSRLGPSQLLTIGELVRRAHAVPHPVPDQVVDLRGFSQEPPFPHRKWNAFKLFQLASFLYRWTGRFTEVKRAPGVDIMHWTYPLPIRMQGVPNVYTIHDAIPFRLPYAINENMALIYRVCSAIAETADAVFTVSEYSRNDLQSLFPSLEGKIVNTYQAVPDVDDDTVPLARTEFANLGLCEERYFCYVGSVEPRKNIMRLLECHARADTDHDLVLIGPLVNCSSQEEKALKRYRRLNNVHFLEYISRESLEALLGNAKALVFPSLLEGFGLPLLESLQLGTPVIASGSTSLREIGGDAVTYIDPYSKESLRSALRHFASKSKDELFPLREADARLDLFSPESYSDRLEEAYGNLLGRGGKE